jgi:Secretion system C-terminal sorting domain
MAFIRKCCISAVMVFCIVLNTSAQNVYYPARSSEMLKATAEDAKVLLQKAVAGSSFTTQSYSNLPSKGIVFVYDSTITDNQACKVESNGYDYIKFTAAEDNGLHFGFYQYLNSLGYRFYQPGELWEIIPQLSSVFKSVNTVYTCAYKYKTWFISGGYNSWAMDKAPKFTWDLFGINGHNWAIYQRRNGMLGAGRFSGHRDDIMRGDYLTTLQNNPCYVANFNGSRAATTQSVPDIFNSTAKNLWANAIESKYTAYKNSIYSNQVFYANVYRSFRYNYGSFGIEVPDGSRFGNSKENEICSAASYPKESDQHFVLANHTTEKILTKYPDMRFQLYAYSNHADVPSPSITIHKNIDIQLIPTVYQLESSTNGLRNRWYNRSSNVSEYQYLNLSAWSGETPSFNWDDLKTTLNIAKEKKSQGIIWEATPAKFGSLPYLLAANNFLKDNIEIDSTLHEFCNNMFASANNTVFKIFKMWGEENTAPNKYNLQLYIGLLQTATQQTENAPTVVKERLRELKAYVHYMVMYFNLANDDQNKQLLKEDRDAKMCLYLAKTNRMQLVNSYYLIANIVSKYAATSDFRAKYNHINGTAYQNGNLPLITAAEIDADFRDDVNKYADKIGQFIFKEAVTVKGELKTQNITALPVINLKLGYTNGVDNYNKTSFNFIAPQSGSFIIKYTPKYDTPGKGFINFTVEATDQTLQILKDVTLNHTASEGTITVEVPRAGSYLLTVISKYKTAIDLSITTNGNYFYKGKAFLGNTTESYKADFTSLPGFFYVPAGIERIYCNIANFNGIKYANPDVLSKSFSIKDNNGNAVTLRLASSQDSSLYYIDIAKNEGGVFYQVTSVAQYGLKFCNISNLLWYAQRTKCSNSGFTVTLINRNGNCITRLSTTESAANLKWQVTDKGNVTYYNNQTVVELPANISRDAIIILTNGNGCNFSGSLGTDARYLKEKDACSQGGAAASILQTTPAIYPNPSAGIFKCSLNGSPVNADEISIFNTQGTKVGSFKNVQQFNLGGATAGMYVYRMVVGGQTYSGKVVKL